MNHAYGRSRNIYVGVAAGLATCFVYPLLIAVSLPRPLTVVLSCSIGPLLGIACWGLREFLNLSGRKVTADLGAASNAMAGALFTAMLLVQLAIKTTANSPSPETAAVWLGLDVAWDVYIGLGTILFSISAFSHPRLGKAVGVSGSIIGLALLVLNISTFPTPPASAGLVDPGPFVGLWYLITTVAMLRSRKWISDTSSTIV